MGLASGALGFGIAGEHAMIRKILTTAALIALVTSAAVANAAGTISSGPFTVGIGNNGELYDFNSGIGFLRVADGFDPLAPGNPRDSWGITTNLGSAYADQAYYGSQNITGTSFTGLGGSSATSTSTTSVGVDVRQTYKFATPNVLAITHVVTNTSASALTVSFQREWDLDVTPTAFNENSFGPVGFAAGVLETSINGFDSPDPATPYGFNCGTSYIACNSIGDLGGGIKIDLGTIAAGGSKSFTYYYAISDRGQTIYDLANEAYLAGLQFGMFTQSSENGLFESAGINSALIGIGSVPEPANWALLIAGFGLVGAAMRRRQTAVTAA
jgi:hypothetical protein